MFIQTDLLPLMTESRVLFFDCQTNYPLLTVAQIPTSLLLHISDPGSQVAVCSCRRHLVFLIELQVISCQCEMTLHRD